MKKVLLAALMMAMTIGANAQDDNSGRRQRPQMNRQQMVEFRIERMTKELSLSTEQQAKIKEILTDEMKDMPERGEMRQGEQPSKEKMEQMKAKREETNKKIEALLNDEQKTKYKEMNSRRGGFGQRGRGFGQRGRGFGPGNGGPRGQRPERQNEE